MADEIAAAGGVVWRVSDGGVEVALAHRPRYDDWSLPKGKLHKGESALAGAVREVGEEVGSRVAVSRRLGQARYEAFGRPKHVDYWAMRHVGGQFQPSEEVDELRWMPPASAPKWLSYQHDRDVLAAFEQRPLPDAVVLLVRHAKAGKRSEWAGDDRKRPLERAGRRQARDLAGFLRHFMPGRVLSADRLRCVQTVEPVAALLGVGVEPAPEFSDESYLADPEGALAARLALADTDVPAIVCSQGGAIPNLVANLALPDPPASFGTRKAAVWALCFRDGVAVSADYYRTATH